MGTGIKSDREWEAREDARTLATAEEIRKDKARTNRALAASKKLLEEAKANVDVVEGTSPPAKKKMSARPSKGRAGWGNV